MPYGKSQAEWNALPQAERTALASSGGGGTASQQANRGLAASGQPGWYSTSGAYQVFGGRSSGGGLNRLLGGLGGGSTGGRGVGGSPAATASQQLQQGGGGNVVGPPGTQGLQAGGFAPNYAQQQQAPNPFQLQAFQAYQPYMGQLDAELNQNPNDLMAKYRANTAVTDRARAQAGAARGESATGAQNFTTDLQNKVGAGQMLNEYENQRLAHRQNILGQKGQALGGQTGAAGGIAGNQLSMMQGQRDLMGLQQRAGEFQAMYPIEMYKAQTGGVANLLSSLSSLSRMV